MKGYDLIRAVMRDRWRRNFVLPNYTPAGWWECDVFELTDAGYWREYEVKVSVADFRQDAKKCKTRVAWVPVPEEERAFPWQKVKQVQEVAKNKHDLLAAHEVKGPSEFWFVMPAGLVPVTEIPEWAGLLEVMDYGPQHRPQWRYKSGVKKKAPRLHREKCDPKIVQHARGTCYWRMHGALETADAPPEDPEYMI